MFANFRNTELNSEDRNIGSNILTEEDSGISSNTTVQRSSTSVTDIGFVSKEKPKDFKFVFRFLRIEGFQRTVIITEERTDTNEQGSSSSSDNYSITVSFIAGNDEDKELKLPAGNNSDLTAVERSTFQEHSIHDFIRKNPVVYKVCFPHSSDSENNFEELNFTNLWKRLGDLEKQFEDFSFYKNSLQLQDNPLIGKNNQITSGNAFNRQPCSVGSVTLRNSSKDVVFDDGSPLVFDSWVMPSNNKPIVANVFSLPEFRETTPTPNPISDNLTAGDRDSFYNPHAAYTVVSTGISADTSDILNSKLSQCADEIHCCRERGIRTLCPSVSFQTQHLLCTDESNKDLFAIQQHDHYHLQKYEDDLITVQHKDSKHSVDLMLDIPCSVDSMAPERKTSQYNDLGYQNYKVFQDDRESMTLFSEDAVALGSMKEIETSQYQYLQYHTSQHQDYQYHDNQDIITSHGNGNLQKEYEVSTFEGAENFATVPKIYREFHPMQFRLNSASFEPTKACSFGQALELESDLQDGESIENRSENVRPILRTMDPPSAPNSPLDINQDEQTQSILFYCDRDSGEEFSSSKKSLEKQLQVKLCTSCFFTLQDTTKHNIQSSTRIAHSDSSSNDQPLISPNTIIPKSTSLDLKLQTKNKPQFSKSSQSYTCHSKPAMNIETAANSPRNLRNVMRALSHVSNTSLSETSPFNRKYKSRFSNVGTIVKQKECSCGNIQSDEAARPVSNEIYFCNNMHASQNSAKYRPSIIGIEHGEELRFHNPEKDAERFPSVAFISGCHFINNCLKNRHKRRDTSAVQKTISYIRQEWFKIAGSKNSSSFLVQKYIIFCKRLSAEILQWMIKLCDNADNTVLNYALLNNRFNVVRDLLETGYCDFNKFNKAGFTPLFICSSSCLEMAMDTQTVRNILKSVDVNVRSRRQGQTALMVAVSKNHRKMVELLIEVKADLDIQDDNGSTALMYAAEGGHETLVILLLAQKCSTYVKDNNNEDACLIALQAGQLSCALLIYFHRKTLPNDIPT